MLRLRRALVATLGVGFLLAACSGGGKPRASSQPGSSSSESGASATLADHWIGSGPPPHSRLQASSGRLVYSGVEGGKVEIVGLDPLSGSVAWRHTTGVSDRIKGVVDDPMVSDDAVFVLGADVASTAHVVSYATATGNLKWDAKLDAPARSDMYVCGTALCVIEITDSSASLVRLDLASGARIGEPMPIGEPILTQNGNQIVTADRFSGDVEALDATTGAMVWHHTALEAFVGAAVSAQHGWAGFHSNGVWMIWLGPTTSGHLGALSGIRDDGSVLWTRPELAPCPTFYESAADSLLPLAACEATVDLAKKTGTITSIEGVDPGTGQNTWRIPDLAIDITNPAKALERVDTNTYVLVGGTQPVTFDLASGPVSSSSRQPWCGSPAVHDTIGSTSYLRATTYAPCAGADGTVPTPANVPAFAGPTMSGWGIWVQDGKVVGQKVA